MSASTLAGLIKLLPASLIFICVADYIMLGQLVPLYLEQMRVNDELKLWTFVAIGLVVVVTVIIILINGRVGYLQLLGEKEPASEKKASPSKPKTKSTKDVAGG